MISTYEIQGILQEDAEEAEEVGLAASALSARSCGKVWSILMIHDLQP